MKKVLTTLLGAAILSVMAARADEGMWLPSIIAQRFDDMKEHGFKLTPEDLYSVNHASLKDAIVRFGGGCTGELVSADGLLFTNHHCGYSYIQKHSSVEHDYLKDGFWAMNREQELPNPGLTVSFLDRMEDVTAAVLKGCTPLMSEEQREALVKENSARLVKEATKDGKGLKASVEPLYYGNTYYLFVYRVFSDVRLVGAPPSSIGKFGGDTDNWMWPRHTGDFSIFRVYAGKDNAPADYSPENVPYHPKRFFKISTAGVQEGDFTFVYGFPGTTREYITSDEVRYIMEVSDPRKIALRTKRLEIQKKYMDSDQKIRIQYSSKYASTANAWKKWQGEAGGLAKNDAVNRKRSYEKAFSQWAAGTEYQGVLDTLHALYQKREPYYLAYEYYNETVRPIEIVQFAANVVSAISKGDSPAGAAEVFFKDYCQSIDEEIFCAMMSAFGSELPCGIQPQFYKDAIARYGSVEGWKNALFAGTVFTCKDKVLALGKQDLESIKADPAYLIYSEFLNWYRSTLRPVITGTGSRIDLAMRTYMRGQMAFESGKSFYPDANHTLRITYGNVGGYSPADGVSYVPVSTLKGIIEKDNPEIFDYNIPQRLRDIYAAGGHEGQPVCFLATNHTTGGNSGSPVMDAWGNLVGINFDRVWEGTMSDVMYDPAICRNISLDVRYLLFNIREIGHAEYLLEEMTLVP